MSSSAVFFADDDHALIFEVIASIPETLSAMPLSSGPASPAAIACALIWPDRSTMLSTALITRLISSFIPAVSEAVLAEFAEDIAASIA